MLSALVHRYTRTHREGRRGLSIRASLALLVSLCVLPAIAIAVAMAAHEYAAYRARELDHTLLLARNIASGVERDLVAVEAGLRVLASSVALEHGDLQSFHAQARDTLQFQSIDSIVLVDRTGRQLVNTRVDFGRPLPVGTGRRMRAVFEEHRTVFTDLFVGPVTGMPVFAVGVPVPVPAGAPELMLSAGLAPGRIGAALARHPLPDGWFGAVLDGRGTIVGRTRDAERFVGQPAYGPLRERIAREREGTLSETATKEGIPVVTAWAPIGTTGWTVVVGSPRADGYAALARSILWIALGCAAVIAVCAVSVLRFARNISRAIEGLVGPAQAVGAGSVVVTRRSGLREIDAVSNALVAASHALADAKHDARHDPLTGLPNRVMLEERLAASRELSETRRRPFALLAIDLDGFKTVNDRHGHAVGDRVLREAAERIRATVRARDLAARLGGDEFAVVIEGAGKAEARVVADDLVRVLSRPYRDACVSVSASVGIAEHTCGGAEPLDIVERADLALYAAKAQGKRQALTTTQVRHMGTNAPGRGRRKGEA